MSALSIMPGFFSHHQHRCFCFQTTALAAAAQYPIILRQRYMAKFPRESIISAVYLAVNYHAQANAPAQVYHHYVPLGLGYTKLLFSQSNKARVVLNISRYTHLGRYQLCQALPSRIKESIIYTHAGIDKPRHPYADTHNLFLS